jgi:hypothetical protein
MAKVVKIRWTVELDQFVHSIWQSYQSGSAPIDPAVYGRGPNSIVRATIQVIRSRLMADLGKHITADQVRSRMRVLGLLPSQ